MLNEITLNGVTYIRKEQKVVSKSAGDFSQGLKDYRAGIPRKKHQSIDYDQGYTIAYQNDRFKGSAK